MFGVGRADDAAVAVVDRLRATFPALAMKLVIDERRWGTNGKVSNLINMAEQARIR